jgi:hypothetical protein
METRVINWNNAYAYLVKRLSVILQKVIAQNVNKRLTKLSSHSSMVNQDPAFHYEAMMNGELIGWSRALCTCEFGLEIICNGRFQNKRREIDITTQRTRSFKV